MSRAIRAITALFLWMGFVTAAATAASADTPDTTSRQWNQVTTTSTVSPAPTRDSSVMPLTGVACWKWSPYITSKNAWGALLWKYQNNWSWCTYNSKIYGTPKSYLSVETHYGWTYEGDVSRSYGWDPAPYVYFDDHTGHFGEGCLGHCVYNSYPVLNTCVYWSGAGHYC